MKLTASERRDHILQMQSPNWEIVKQEYDRLKFDHRLTDADIASWFDYANVNSFRTSKAYRRVVTGVVRVWLKTQ